MSLAPISGRAQDNIWSLQIHGEVIRRFLKVRREDRTFRLQVPSRRSAPRQQEGRSRRRWFKARGTRRACTCRRTPRSAQRSPCHTPLRRCPTPGSQSTDIEPVSGCWSFEQSRIISWI